MTHSPYLGARFGAGFSVPNDKLDASLAAAVSPEFDAISKFATGAKENHGPQAGMLARACQRFVSGMLGEAARARETVGHDGSPESDIAAKLHLAVTADRPGMGVYHMNFATRGYQDKMFGAMRDVLSTRLENGVNGFISRFHRETIAKPGLAVPTVLATLGTVGLFTGGGPLAMGMIALGLLGRRKAQKNAIPEDRVNEKIGHPIEIQRVPLGHLMGTQQDNAMPSAEFIDLAKSSLAHRLGDEQMAVRQLGFIDQEFTFQASNNEAVVVSSLGVSLNSRDGVYTISQQRLDGTEAVIAREANGMLEIIDQNAVDALQPDDNRGMKLG